MEYVKIGRVKITRTYIEDRIEKDPKTKCWNWQGMVTKTGHPVGMMYTQMHRAAKMLYHGSTFPEGMMADHICRNPGCVNPDHIRIVNRKINVEHAWDAKTGSMSRRRLRVVRWMHDCLTERMAERMSLDD